MWFTTSLILGVVVVSGFFWWRRRCQLISAELNRVIRESAIRYEESAEKATASAAHQSALFDNMVEGFLLLDADNRVQMINASLRQLFGIESDIAGKTLMEVFRLHELNELTERVHELGEVTEFEIESNSLGGKILEINAVSLSDHSGARRGAMLVFHDLTRIKQLENSRREFVANVSHELRTPLSMIKGYVETLLDGALTDEAVAGKFLKTIDKHADRLTFLIEDLLTVSRLESGQENMNFHTVPLHEVVERTIEDLTQKADERGVRIESDVKSNITVQADAPRLQQVFFNLIDNAIKYGAIDGRVSVSAELKDEGLVDVSVTDDGAGIPAEAAERIFERFYRVDKARSREQGGTGLGLAIVKHIIQAHGGEVRVESNEGQGTAFHFTLKLAG
jgi:two-component system phosphate regulon sensor histidine kinase PhoR